MTLRKWEQAGLPDADAINALADRVHISLPESSSVFREKIALFPEGCRKLVEENRIVGYGIAHPWKLREVPPLDTLLLALPKTPECIYIHDVVVAPEARGSNAAADYVAYVKRMAKSRQISYLALVSVYGTDVLWSRFGFLVENNAVPAEKLSTYGDSAKYMTCHLDD